MILSPSRRLATPDYCPNCGKVRHPRRAPTFPARRSRWLPSRWRGGVPATNSGTNIQYQSATNGISCKSGGIVVAGASDPCCCAACTICSYRSATITLASVSGCTGASPPLGTWTLPFWYSTSSGGVTNCWFNLYDGSAGTYSGQVGTSFIVGAQSDPFGGREVNIQVTSSASITAGANGFFSASQYPQSSATCSYSPSTPNTDITGHAVTCGQVILSSFGSMTMRATGGTCTIVWNT